MRFRCQGIQLAMAALVSAVSFGGIVSAQIVEKPTVTTESVRFDGDLVVRVEITSRADLDFMLQISPDVWSESVGIGPVDFRMASADVGALAKRGLAYDILIPDLQMLIDAENDRGNQELLGWFENYQNRSAVNTYLNTLIDLRPDLAEIIELGDSIEGRPMRGIHITGSGGAADKPGVFLNGCQHAREWITVMSSMYFADRLIRDYDTDPVVKDLVDNLDFYIVPIVNPDGYEYTWTTNRLWRKNRRSGGGVDLNRNWSVGWGEPGSSGSPASEIYRGTAPFSEPESAAVRDFVLDHPNILYHNDIHSYSQLILQPWGWTRDLPFDHDVLDAMGQAMQDAVFSIHGMTYRHGPIFTTIYPASGVMSDWFYGARSAFSVSYELRDRGQYGFLLPANQILPTAEEAFAGILAEVTHSVPRRMMLDLMEPAVWGGTLQLRAARSTPGGRVYFLYSLIGIDDLPNTPIPQLDVTINLRKPKLLDQASTNDAGVAAVQHPLPNYNQFRRVFFQAVEMENVTNWLMVDIPES